MTAFSNIPNFPPISLTAETVGIDVRQSHYQELIENDLNIGWLEVHPENCFEGEAHRYFLNEARKKYQISFHTAGLSVAADQAADKNHLTKIKELVDIYQPLHVSDHNLPALPYTELSLDRLARNIDRTQEILGQTILITTPSKHAPSKDNEMHEEEFMNAIAQMTGCGLRIDLNTIYVQAHNRELDPREYIETIDARHVGEMRIAGDNVWPFFEHAVEHIGAVPTLISQDKGASDFEGLIDAANKARAIINKIITDDQSHETSDHPTAL